jgi:hypothetical protein
MIENAKERCCRCCWGDEVVERDPIESFNNLIHSWSPLWIMSSWRTIDSSLRSTIRWSWRIPTSFLRTKQEKEEFGSLRRCGLTVKWFLNRSSNTSWFTLKGIQNISQINHYNWIIANEIRNKTKRRRILLI